MGEYSTNVGSRTFLIEDDYAYKLFQLKNKEFTYTVDDSNLDCGLNGALYFVQMDADGGKEKYGNAGAQLGLGYCAAQRLTSGRRTRWPLLTRCTPALRVSRLAARAPIAVTTVRTASRA